MANTFNPSTREAETGRSLSLRPAWSTEWVPAQIGIHRETLSSKIKMGVGGPVEVVKMPQQLRALAALLENPVSIPSTDMMVHNHL